MGARFLTLSGRNGKHGKGKKTRIMVGIGNSGIIHSVQYM